MSSITRTQTPLRCYDAVDRTFYDAIKGEKMKERVASGGAITSAFAYVFC